MEDKSSLSKEEINHLLEKLDGWSQDGDYIQKDFIFENFKEINAFLPYLTETIVNQNHHPEFEFNSGEKKVSIRVTTHSHGDITQADINLATSLNHWPRP